MNNIIPEADRSVVSLPRKGFKARLSEHKWALVGLLVCQLGQVCASLVLPSLSADMIDKGIVAAEPSSIIHYGWLMLLAALIQLVLSVTAVTLGARISFSVARDLRAEIFDKVHKLALSQVREFSVGSLITRCTNDVLQVQTMMVMGLTMIMIAPIMGVGGAIMAIRQDAKLSFIILFAVPVVAFIVASITLRATPLFRKMQKLIDRVNSVLREQIDGIRVIRAFLQQSREAERFGQANDNLTNTSLRAGRLMAINMPAVSAVMQLTSVALVWAGGTRVVSGDLEIGSLIASLSYIALILISVMMMGMLVVMLPRALVSINRVNQLLDRPVLVAPPASPIPLVGNGLMLKFDQVNFGYAGAKNMVLEDISFELKAGEVLGIIGATGSGKSTLVNLITRLNDPMTGRITLNGIDLKSIAPEDLATRIGYVPQKAFLFSGSIAEALKLGAPDADEAMLWHALDIAQASDFVHKLPAGLDAPVAQGGTNFSGGQRQRLAIARALVCNADLYVFDDSFSALDQATDARLRQALREEVMHAATVIVGQRVASIKDADRILVIEKGRIVGLGAHDVLLESCPVYADIVKSQQSADEAAA